MTLIHVERERERQSESAEFLYFCCDASCTLSGLMTGIWEWPTQINSVDQCVSYKKSDLGDISEGDQLLKDPPKKFYLLREHQGPFRTSVSHRGRFGFDGGGWWLVVVVVDGVAGYSPVTGAFARGGSRQDGGLGTEEVVCKKSVVSE